LVEFLDLHIIPRVDDEPSCTRTAQLLALSGYNAVGLTVPTGLLRDRLDILRDCFQDSGVEVFLRVDLTCAKREELLKLLRRFRPTFDIIGVKCTNHRLALVAARDRRVDLIFFDSATRHVWFDDAIANVSNATLELNLSTLFEMANHLILTKLMKDVRIARRHNVDMVLSSGATSPLLVRTPIQLAAIAEILGLSKQQAINGVSTIPSHLLNANVERRSRNYVEEGVKTIVG
jgi:ribonuclease P/MRP protein subunit RPP1